MKTNKSRKTSAATLVVWLAASATALAMASPMMPVQKSESYQQAQAALDDGEWRLASDLFDQVVEAKEGDADGALYWSAYSLHKQGRDSEAGRRLRRLMSRFPDSSWIDDAQALGVEIDGRDPQEISDEELKVYALNSLMSADPERAVPVLEEFLAGSSSEKLKKQALFVLSQSDSARARQVLAEVATGALYPELRRQAVEYLGISGDPESHAVLEQIYGSTNDLEVKRSVLQSFMISGQQERLLSIAKNESSPELRKIAIEQLAVMGAAGELHTLYRSETSPEIKNSILEGLMIGGEAGAVHEIATTDPDPEMRERAIEFLGVMGAGDELGTMYEGESSPELRGKILEAYMIGGHVDALESAARLEQSPELRMKAIEYLGISGGERVGEILNTLYEEASEIEVRSAVINALFLQNNSEQLVEIVKNEEHSELRRAALERLALLGSDEAVDFLIEALREPTDG